MTPHGAQHLQHPLRLAVLALLISCFAFGPHLEAWSQGIGHDRPSARTRRAPIKVKLSGFLNTDPAPEALAVLNLGLTGFRGQYQLEVAAIEAVNSPQMTPRQILLHREGKRRIDLDVTGPRELLSKIAQSQPGTPLALTAWYTQRDGEFRLESVDIIGF